MSCEGLVSVTDIAVQVRLSVLQQHITIDKVLVDVYSTKTSIIYDGSLCY